MKKKRIDWRLELTRLRHSMGRTTHPASPVFDETEVESTWPGELLPLPSRFHETTAFGELH